MNRFWAFVKKEFYHIFRDYRTMLILFAMPVAQVLIFGFVISMEVKDARIAILDKSKDEVTRDITGRLLSSGYFKAGGYLDSEKEIGDAFNFDRVKMVVVFEPDFSQHLNKDGHGAIQLIADAADANTARLLTTYCEGILAGYQQEINQSQLSAAKLLVPEVRMFYNESLDDVFMSIPGIMAMILLLVSAMMTSISITREKEFGSMEVLLISPLKPFQIIIGKVAPYVGLALINAISIILMGYFVFHMPVKGSVVLLLFECLLFTILALSLGIFISTIAKNQMVAMFISMFGLMLPTILLSGFIFPIENMPLPLQILSQIMPPKWFIVIVKKVMLKGVGLAYVWKETLIIIGYIVFFVTVSVKKFKIRLE
ncbi:ABC transporter permease [Marinilabiliaceae bacterium JC017]|nr:ABC transporter permease [Marinilabiliaceae bacterium JC017]